MPAVTIADITVLPRVNEVVGGRARAVKSITTAPQGYEGEGFPVRRAFAGVDMAELDPLFIWIKWAKLNTRRVSQRNSVASASRF